MREIYVLASLEIHLKFDFLILVNFFTKFKEVSFAQSGKKTVSSLLLPCLLCEMVILTKELKLDKSFCVRLEHGIIIQA